MKRKAPLSLMEQMVMILVFALAAALCLQAFVKSDRLSRRAEAQSQASRLCQSVAELTKHSGGDYRSALLEVSGVEPGYHLPSPVSSQFDYCYVCFDGDWKPIGPGEDENGAAYALRVDVPAESLYGGTPGLVSTWIRVLEGEDVLFELEAAWQTEMADTRLDMTYTTEVTAGD